MPDRRTSMGWSARSNTFRPQTLRPRSHYFALSWREKATTLRTGGEQCPADKAKQRRAGSAFYAKALNFSNLMASRSWSGKSLARCDKWIVPPFNPFKASIIGPSYCLSSRFDTCVDSLGLCRSGGRRTRRDGFWRAGCRLGLLVGQFLIFVRDDVCGIKQQGFL